MTQLSVNVNKIATLRNARGGEHPNVVSVSLDLIKYGAHGITVHPRPDERHIKKTDVYDLSTAIKAYNSTSEKYIEFNIEGYPSKDFLQLIKDVKPDQCTLVPDPPDVLTSNAGWRCVENKQQLIDVVSELHSINVRSSLFIEPSAVTPKELLALKEIKPRRCELYTEAYARSYQTSHQTSVVQDYKNVADQITELGIELNAGHDLNLANLGLLIKTIPQLKELSIGHAFVCESLYMGLEKTIHSYLKELAQCH